MQQSTKPNPGDIRLIKSSQNFQNHLIPVPVVRSISPVTAGAADCSPKQGCLKTDSWAGAGGCDLCVHCAYI
jgi:hypothetical protein